MPLRDHALERRYTARAVLARRDVLHVGNDNAGSDGGES
jgi:hypothetical protein